MALGKNKSDTLKAGFSTVVVKDGRPPRVNPKRMWRRESQHHSSVKSVVDDRGNRLMKIRTVQWARGRPEEQQQCSWGTLAIVGLHLEIHKAKSWGYQRTVWLLLLKKRRSFCVCSLGFSCWKIEKLRRFIQGCIPAQVLWDFKKTSVANWSTALPPHLTWIACQWLTCWYLSWATLLLVEWGAGVPITSEVSVRIRTY